MYFPKKYDNELNGLVAQLNKLLGGQFFKLILHHSQSCIIYELALIKTDSLLNLSIDTRYEYSFKEMRAYLNGLIRGIKLALKNNH